jgi:DNA modification methylase
MSGKRKHPSEPKVVLQPSATSGKRPNVPKIIGFGKSARKNRTIPSKGKESIHDFGTSTPSTQHHILPCSQIDKPFRLSFRGDARDVSSLLDPKQPGLGLRGLPDSCVDLVITSPPYWKKRDYGFDGQIGLESRPEAYVEQIVCAMSSWRRVLRPEASVFINIGDTYWQKSLQGIPSMIESAARSAGWRVRNRIVWVKKGGMPDPARDRLASRHEYVIHFAMAEYYYDLFGYSEKYSANLRGANPGDVWELGSELELGEHLAPFPTEIARRAILLACPSEVCSRCGKARKRIVERTHDLDPARPQARRAIELAKLHKLTPAHLAAIRATGISDAGKARQVQTGTDKNTKQVQKLAQEAKAALGGYFREFTFAKKRSAGWTKCSCHATFIPGVVLDPFMGTGTTLDVANELGRSAIGVDLSTLAFNKL